MRLVYLRSGRIQGEHNENIESSWRGIVRFILGSLIFINFALYALGQPQDADGKDCVLFYNGCQHKAVTKASGLLRYCFCFAKMVVDTRFELVTPAMSMQCSTAELIDQ